LHQGGCGDLFVDLVFRVGDPELAPYLRGLDLERQNAVTPGFALLPFRASLITLVSIKYIAGGPRLLNALEILIPADIGHRRQDLREREAAGENWTVG
jgi:hypothetical protein